MNCHTYNQTRETLEHPKAILTRIKSVKVKFRHKYKSIITFNFYFKNNC